MFNIKQLSRNFATTQALKDLNFTMDKGLHIIVGPSGSGKSTLLRILSGMDMDYEGSVQLAGQELKEIGDLPSLYNQVFGFVWQEAHLIESMSVLDEVLLPQYLKQNVDEKEAIRLLKEFGLYEHRDALIKTLSGGEKQRVAIISELMKHPQVIFADEPTSALDPKSAQELMVTLRKLAKTRLVVLVTHDESLITKSDTVIRLHDGSIESVAPTQSVKHKQLELSPSGLQFSNAASLTWKTIKQAPLTFVLKTFIVILSSFLLISGMSGVVSDESSASFDQLFDTYGSSLMDISIYSSFISASGTDPNADGKPKSDVEQNIMGIFDKYNDNPRISVAAYIQPYDDIKVNFEGKEIVIETSNNVPVFRDLLAGAMPKSDDRGVLVPNSLVKKMGLSNEDAIGKTIEFKASVKGKPFTIEVPILGVIDSTAVSVYEGEKYEYEIEDSFFFSKIALEEMSTSTGIKPESLSFFMRATSPQTLIEIRDELSAKGITPLGMFELVEDLVKLSDQTGTQSAAANVVLIVLSPLMVLAIFIIAEILRRKDIAVYKAMGYQIKDLIMLNSMQLLPALILSFIIVTLVFKANIFMVLIPYLLAVSVSAFVAMNVQIAKQFQVGKQL